ncbi:MAG TPA: polysaccharide deacetylase family protein [Fimbriimonadaceae bacterium]|nr:polysaccharide deacetylase family protein [Fimbriimonadaceae bacterium]
MIVVLAALVFAAPARVDPPVVGDRIAPFTLATREGRPFEWKPKRATVICFCAFWCDTWKDQLPRVREAEEALRGLPVDFLTVSVDGRWSERGKQAAVGADLSDQGNRWCSSIGIDRVPYTLLLDKEGVVRWASYGVLRSLDLVGAARQALAGKGSGGAVYLTFDDFPAPKGNDELLDVLRAQRVPATFFCVCSRLDAYSDAVRRAVAEGHRLEIHAWIHDEPRTDLAKCQAALRRFGGDGSLFRPHGSEYVLDASTMARLSFPVVDPYDFQRPGKDELIRRISGSVRPGAVIQLHAGAQETVAALPDIIAKLRQRGFVFESLEKPSG